MTTEDGQIFVCPSPLHPTSADFVKIVNDQLGPFLRQAMPDHSSYTLLLDGETIMHTKEAEAALKANRIRILPDWPASSPDLKPQENVWGWADNELRRTEKKEDNVATFKRRILMACKKYCRGASHDQTCGCNVSQGRNLLLNHLDIHLKDCRALSL